MIPGARGRAERYAGPVAEDADVTRPQTRRILTRALFTIYAIMLTGVILVKLPFSLQGAGSERIVNLVPLAGSFTADGALLVGEIIENALVFVPLGIFIGALKGDWSFAKKIRPIIGITVAFEALQYLLAIGRADITDVLSNTLGGLVGIGCHAALGKLFKQRTNAVIDAAALIMTVCALVFFAYLSTRSRSLYR